MPRYQPITPAELDWRDGAPFDRRHRDIYYSLEGGLAESRHVFLRGNALPPRWRGEVMDHQLAVQGLIYRE